MSLSDRLYNGNNNYLDSNPAMAMWEWIDTRLEDNDWDVCGVFSLTESKGRASQRTGKKETKEKKAPLDLVHHLTQIVTHHGSNAPGAQEAFNRSVSHLANHPDLQSGYSAHVHNSSLRKHPDLSDADPTVRHQWLKAGFLYGLNNKGGLVKGGQKSKDNIRNIAKKLLDKHSDTGELTAADWNRHSNQYLGGRLKDMSNYARREGGKVYAGGDDEEVGAGDFGKGGGKQPKLPDSELTSLVKKLGSKSALIGGKGKIRDRKELHAAVEKAMKEKHGSHYQVTEPDFERALVGYHTGGRPLSKKQYRRPGSVELGNFRDATLSDQTVSKQKELEAARASKIRRELGMRGPNDDNEFRDPEVLAHIKKPKPSPKHAIKRGEDEDTHLHRVFSMSHLGMKQPAKKRRDESPTEYEARAKKWREDRFPKLKEKMAAHERAAEFRPAADSGDYNVKQVGAALSHLTGKYASGGFPERMDEPAHVADAKRAARRIKDKKSRDAALARAADLEEPEELEKRADVTSQEKLRAGASKIMKARGDTSEKSPGGPSKSAFSKAMSAGREALFHRIGGIGVTKRLDPGFSKKTDVSTVTRRDLYPQDDDEEGPKEKKSALTQLDPKTGRSRERALASLRTAQSRFGGTGGPERRPAKTGAALDPDPVKQGPIRPGVGARKAALARQGDQGKKDWEAELARKAKEDKAKDRELEPKRDERQAAFDKKEAEREVWTRGMRRPRGGAKLLGLDAPEKRAARRAEAPAYWAARKAAAKEFQQSRYRGSGYKPTDTENDAKEQRKDAIRAKLLGKRRLGGSSSGPPRKLELSPEELKRNAKRLADQGIKPRLAAAGLADRPIHGAEERSARVRKAVQRLIKGPKNVSVLKARKDERKRAAEPKARHILRYDLQGNPVRSVEPGDRQRTRDAARARKLARRAAKRADAAGDQGGEQEESLAYRVFGSPYLAETRMLSLWERVSGVR